MQKLMIATVAAAALMSFAAVAQTPTRPNAPTGSTAPNYSSPNRDGPNSNCESIVDPAARTRCLNNMNPDPSQAQAPRASGSGTTNMPSTTTTTTPPSRSK